jgi:hypothetical protein
VCPTVSYLCFNCLHLPTQPYTAVHPHHSRLRHAMDLADWTFPHSAVQCDERYTLRLLTTNPIYYCQVTSFIWTSTIPLSYHYSFLVTTGMMSPDNPQQAINHFFPGTHNIYMKDAQFIEVMVFLKYCPLIGNNPNP